MTEYKIDEQIETHLSDDIQAYLNQEEAIKRAMTNQTAPFNELDIITERTNDSGTMSTCLTHLSILTRDLDEISSDNGIKQVYVKSIAENGFESINQQQIVKKKETTHKIKNWLKSKLESNITS